MMNQRFNINNTSNKVRFQPYPIKLNSINSSNFNNKNIDFQKNFNKQNVRTNIIDKNETQANKITSILKKSKLNQKQNSSKINNTFNQNSNKFQFKNEQQNQKNYNFQPKIFKSDSISSLVFPQNYNQQSNNYDLRDYKETNQLMRNKFNTQSKTQSQQQQQQQQQQQKTKENNTDISQLKILTTPIDKIKSYQEKFQNKHNFLFETIAQLDSVITDYPNDGRQFYIKDATNNENMLNNRILCVFYEIDRKLPNLVRGSYIRCVGQYNLKKKIFKCFSVRSAHQSELMSFTSYVDLTEKSIIEYF